MILFLDNMKLWVFILSSGGRTHIIVAGFSDFLIATYSIYSVYLLNLVFLLVYAINSLHDALGSPPLPGWISNGGDPCVEGWQGVQCMDSNITGMYGDFLANVFFPLSKL